jgi:hypothetical protein
LVAISGPTPWFILVSGDMLLPLGITDNKPIIVDSVRIPLILRRAFYAVIALYYIYSQSGMMPTVTALDIQAIHILLGSDLC